MSVEHTFKRLFPTTGQEVVINCPKKLKQVTKLAKMLHPRHIMWVNPHKKTYAFNNCIVQTANGQVTHFRGGVK